LVSALKEFYAEVQARAVPEKPLQVFDPLKIRRELFKLGYGSGNFDLHSEGDAQELLEFVLRSMHDW